MKSELIDHDNAASENTIANGEGVTQNNALNNNENVDKIKNEKDDIKPKIRKVRIPKSAYPISCDLCGKVNASKFLGMIKKVECIFKIKILL